MRLSLFFLFISTQLLFSELNLTKIVQSTLLSFSKESNASEKIDASGLKNFNELKEKLEKKKLANEEKRLTDEADLKKRQLQTEISRRKEQEKLEKERLEREIFNQKLAMLDAKKQEIDEYLNKDNIWTSIYYNYETYQRLSKEQDRYNAKIHRLKNKTSLNTLAKKELESLENKQNIIHGKLSQVEDYKKNPLASLMKIPQIDEVSEINNPLDIITAMSFQKHLQNTKEENSKRYILLEKAVEKLEEKNEILKNLAAITHGSQYNTYVDELRATGEKLSDVREALAIFKTALNKYRQEVRQANLKVDESIEQEIKKSIKTGSIVLFLLLFFFFIKYLISRYMSENDLFYSINKVVNLIFIALVFLIVLFSYLENVESLMTVLGFASAGIAIALKDWFMSVLGWFVILMSGSIHVGDRVKFVKDGVEYVGDIVDISILRMTLHEDVTLTTVFTNRRGGRMIFIPNNYVFTDMIANYSHSGLKTVWDGIDFYITFDSNIPKAQSIAKEVTRKYSKGYTDMTRKQLNRLRSKYSMRNTAVEPRILSFIDKYGVCVSAWYLTNAFATLTLRSTISMEILARLKEEDDIFLAFPSQSIYMEKPAPKNFKNEDIMSL